MPYTRGWTFGRSAPGTGGPGAMKTCSQQARTSNRYTGTEGRGTGLRRERGTSRGPLRFEWAPRTRAPTKSPAAGRSPSTLNLGRKSCDPFWPPPEKYCVVRPHATGRHRSRPAGSARRGRGPKPGRVRTATGRARARASGPEGLPGAGEARGVGV